MGLGVREILGQMLHFSSLSFPLCEMTSSQHTGNQCPPPQPAEPHSSNPPPSPSTDSVPILPCTPSMDRDGTMTIDWQEWRDHFLLHSLENVEDVVYFWKHSTVRWGQLS